VPRKGLSGNARETRKINYLTPPSLHRLYQGNVPLSIANQALTYELYSTLFRLGDRRISSHRPLSGDYPQTTTSTTDLWIYGSMRDFVLLQHAAVPHRLRKQSIAESWPYPQRRRRPQGIGQVGRNLRLSSSECRGNCASEPVIVEFGCGRQDPNVVEVFMRLSV
jgi:hypothetical protein